MRQGQDWIVTADARRASLFACRREALGELHLEPLTSLENHHEGEHERGRPMLAGGAARRGSVARSGARAAPQAMADRHVHEEEDRRFAREVASWLTEARQSSDRHRVTVFAPPDFLGKLRDQLKEDQSIQFREGELTRLRPHELAGHPAVLDAVVGS
jgi:protein required for attachment to host cells